MKKIFLTILILLIAIPCSAGVLTTDAKVKLNDYKAEILAVHPNYESICISGTGLLCERELIYTDAEWIDEIVKRYLLQVIRSGERQLYIKTLVEQSVVLE